MIRPFILSIALTLPTLLSAQSGPVAIKPDPAMETERREKTIFTEADPGTIVTLEIPTTELDEKQLFLLEENLLKFHGKILNCTYKKDKQLFKFSYNEHMHLDELIECFQAASVSYYKEQ